MKRAVLCLALALLKVPTARAQTPLDVTFHLSPSELRVYSLDKDASIVPVPPGEDGSSRLVFSPDGQGGLSPLHVYFVLPNDADPAHPLWQSRAVDLVFDKVKSSQVWPTDGGVKALPVPEELLQKLRRVRRREILKHWSIEGAVGLGLLLLVGLPLTRRALASQKARVAQKHRSEFLESLEAMRGDDSRIGVVLGHYRLVSFLGSGGMARVYRGINNETLDESQPYALKLMIEQDSASAEFRKRFLREAQLGRDLSHPSVVRILDYGDQDGMLYLVMEMIDGGSLRDKMLPGQGLPPRECWTYMQPVFEGLLYVHNQHVVHRDLKPENIMVTKSGRVVIMDFGLARRHDFSMLTGTGNVLGTPAYMSPEQIMGDPPVDATSDQYALGIMLFEMLTGSLPFLGITDPVQMIMKHMNEKPALLRALRPDLSAELEAAISRMLEKKPDKRFPSLHGCRLAIEPLLLKD